MADEARPAETTITTGAPPPVAPPAAPPPPTLAELGDGEIEDGKSYKVHGSVIRGRVERGVQSALRKLGVEPDELPTKLKRLSDMEAAAEEAKRAQMTETERLKTDLTAATARAEAAERKLGRAKEMGEIRQQSKRLAGVAKDVFDVSDRDAFRFAVRATLKDLSKKMTPKQLDELDDVGLKKAMVDYAKAHPKFAKQAVVAGAPKPKPVVRPAESAARSNPRAPTAPQSGDQNAVKTAKPGQGGKTMTKEEIKQKYGVSIG